MKNELQKIQLIGTKSAKYFSKLASRSFSSRELCNMVGPASISKHQQYVTAAIAWGGLFIKEPSIRSTGSRVPSSSHELTTPWLWLCQRQVRQRQRQRQRQGSWRRATWRWSGTPSSRRAPLLVGPDGFQKREGPSARWQSRAIKDKEWKDDQSYLKCGFFLLLVVWADPTSLNIVSLAVPADCRLEGGNALERCDYPVGDLRFWT